jgi:transposase
MEVHARAPLSPIGRRRVVDRVVCEGWSVTAAAEAAGVTERTVYRWLARWRAQGSAGLIDRRSVPGRIPHKTPADRVAAICALRRLRMTGAEIAECLSMPLSTVSAVLLREGLGKRSRLAPLEPPNRYERHAAGDLVHIASRSSAGSSPRVTGSSVIGASSAARAARASPAGSSFTSPSTTTAAWPTPRSSMTSGPPPPWRSCVARSPSLPAMASRSGA